MVTKAIFVINIISSDQLQNDFIFILTDYSSKPHNLKKTNIWEFIHQVLGALTD